MPIDVFLQRLKKIRVNGSGKWIACCPAHDDRSPSLSIKEGVAGKVLIHCWAGCTARDIVDAIGLTLSDLFPRDTGCSSRDGLPDWKRRAYEETLSHELLVIECYRADMHASRTINTEDLLRVKLAMARSKGINEVLSRD